MHSNFKAEMNLHLSFSLSPINFRNGDVLCGNISCGSYAGEGQRETTLTGRPGGSPEDRWMLTTRRDTDYLLRGRQPLRQDPWHRSEGLHPSDYPGPWCDSVVFVFMHCLISCGGELHLKML